MSDNENENNSFEEQDEDITSEVTSSDNFNKMNLNKVPYDENSEIHYLPAKIVYNGKCKVDNFFTTLISENEKEYTSSFRGRKLLGQKKVPKDINFSYTRFRKINNKIIVDKNIKINKYSVWKYDEQIEPNNPFINVERILNELNILK